MNVRAHMLVPPHFFVSTAFKKMRWKDEFRKWLPKFLTHLLSAVRASIFLARRIQSFLSLVDCEVGVCLLTI